MKTKLLTYSGAATAFLLAGNQQLKAQVVYGDVDPDVYVTGNPDDYYLDLNMDGEFEVHFDHIASLGFGSIGCYGVVVPNYFYCFLSYDYDPAAGWSFAIALDAGDPVPSGFNNAPEAINLQHADGSSTYGLGPWISEEDKYLGIWFETPSGDGPYYGWIRLQADECGYYIKDYAYAPGSLFAGEGLPVDECETPAATDVTGIEAEKAKISWDDVAGATSYNVRFRAVGETDWHEKSVDAPKTFIELKTLSCDTEYEWQVQTFCAGTASEFTPLSNFTTLSCRLGDASADFTVFPNPASNNITVNLDEAVENGLIQITDLTGKVVLTSTMSGFQSVIELAELPAGIYVITIAAENEVQRSEFIKQ